MNLKIALCLGFIAIALAQKGKNSGGKGHTESNAPKQNKNSDDESTAVGKNDNEKHGGNKRPDGRPNRGHRVELKDTAAGKFNKPPRHRFDDAQKSVIKAGCGKKGNGCKGQSKKAKEKKEHVKNSLKDALKKRAQKVKGADLSEDELAEIETKTVNQLKKTYDLKVALYKREQIDTEIEPDDDGVWQGDMVLSENLADSLIARFESGDQVDVPILPGDFEADVNLFASGETTADTETMRRAKRFALYLEDNEGARWDKMPIPVLFEETFTDEQKAVIKSALADIEAKTCIRFNVIDDFPEANVAYVFYVKEDYATFCGLSSVGRQGDESMVWLNFEGDCGNQINGSIIHETLHVLGVDHQQVRYDRNENINILFDNIDPQALDLFAQGDTTAYTSYGVPYDLYSIMHYSAQAGVIAEGTNSMLALRAPNNFFTEVLGQRIGLSSRDSELLRRMYCMPDCLDYVVYCGWWATVGYCEDHTASMLEYCPKSCNFCPNEVNKKAQAKVKAAQENAKLLLK